MKKLIIFCLLISMLLSGCDMVSKVSDKIIESNVSGDVTTAEKEEATQISDVNQKTGVEIHDNMPDLAEVGIDEYLAYFEGTEEYVQMPDFVDERATFEKNLAAEKAAAGKNYIDYYNEQSIMVSYFENLVETNLDAYNEGKELDENVFLYLMTFYSMEQAMGASFTEENDWANTQKGMVMAVEMFGGTDVEVARIDAHNYSIAYTKESGERMEDSFRADARNGIQMLSYKDGVLDSFFEYIELGNDTYIWQNDTERMIMTYSDKVIGSCYYSSLNEEATEYTEADLLYGKEITADPSWVTAIENYHTLITFDGTVLDITTTNAFFGGIGHAEITPVEQ